MHIPALRASAHPTRIPPSPSARPTSHRATRIRVTRPAVPTIIRRPTLPPRHATTMAPRAGEGPGGAAPAPAVAIITTVREKERGEVDAAGS
jgi:hypothetical protein